MIFLGLWIDCHNDTLFRSWFRHNHLEKNTQKLGATSDLLIEGGIDVQVAAMFIPNSLVKFGLDITLEMVGLLTEEIRNNSNLYLLKHKSDFSKTQDKKKLGYILAMEGAEPLGNSLGLLPAFYEMGIRVITLTWNRKNLFAEGLQDTVGINEGEGLSPLGKQLVSAMNELGIAIDVSHLNRKGFQDVVKHSTSPFIASHSGVYSLVPQKRNLSDKEIKQIAEADGCIGVVFAPDFLTSNPKIKPATIDDVIQHMTYITNLVGVDYVAVGSDYDGIDQTPVGLENASMFKNLPPRLKEEGFSSNDIDKIMGENWHRIFQNIWTS